MDYPCGKCFGPDCRGNPGYTDPGCPEHGTKAQEKDRERTQPWRRKISRQLREKLGKIKPTLRDAAWIRGLRLATKHGYGYHDDGKDSPERDAAISQSTRDCRIFAMAYEMGWMNGYEHRQRKNRRDLEKLLAYPDNDQPEDW